MQQTAVLLIYGTNSFTVDISNRGLYCWYIQQRAVLLLYSKEGCTVHVSNRRLYCWYCNRGLYCWYTEQTAVLLILQQRTVLLIYGTDGCTVEYIQQYSCIVNIRKRQLYCWYIRNRQLYCWIYPTVQLYCWYIQQRAVLLIYGRDSCTFEYIQQYSCTVYTATEVSTFDIRNRRLYCWYCNRGLYCLYIQHRAVLLI